MIQKLGNFLSIFFTIIFMAAVPCSSASIIVQNNDDLTQSTSAGTGTILDPFRIEKRDFSEPSNYGILISNTDAYLLIKDCTMSFGRLSSPVGIGIKGAKNVQIENCTFFGGELLRVEDSENIQVKNYKGRNLFFEGVNGGLIENCSSDYIIVHEGFSLNLSSDLVSSLTIEDLKSRSQNCSIKNCRGVREIALIGAKNCVVEDCRVEGNGLWIVNPVNITLRNDAIKNATVNLNWAPNVRFENVSLINSEIFLAGARPEDFTVYMDNCTANGKKISCYRNRTQLELDGLEAGQIWLVNCPGSKIKNSSSLGLFLINCSGASIEDSEIVGGSIQLAFSQDCLISDNLLRNLGSKGIVQYTGCYNNTLKGNTMTNADTIEPRIFLSDEPG